jgi:hypothetical protein
MWPFTGDYGVWLALYIFGFALHAVFVSYVLVGTGYALVQAVRRADDPVADRVRDFLPFMLGCGITAGVAPLLFIQLLYQRRFYSANLVMGPRWGAVVPALIVGFYALYVAKAKARWRKPALGVGLACFLFVAWSWTELHLLMQDEPAWREMYAAGSRLYGDGGVAPRLLLWLGVMTTLFAMIAIHWAKGGDRRRLAVIAVAGRVVGGVAVAWLVARGGSIDSPQGAHGWLYILITAVVVELAGWAWTWRVPDGVGVLVATAAGTAALVAGAVVREAPRLAMIDPPRPESLDAGGFATFLATLAFGVIAIVWIAQIVRDSSSKPE